MKLMRAFAAVLAAALVLGGCKSSHRPTRGDYRAESASGRDVSGADVVKESKNALVAEAERWLGTPYKYGGSERGKGTDCSGMTMEIYRKVLGVKIPRNSAEQQRFCTPMKREKLEAGDLVFFSTGKGRGRVGHVGLYVSDGVFVHASSSRGVIASNLDEAYYRTHYHSSGRVPGLPRGAVGVKDKDKRGAVSAAPAVPSVRGKREVAVGDAVAERADSVKARSENASRAATEEAARSLSGTRAGELMSTPASRVSEHRDSVVVAADTCSRRLPGGTGRAIPGSSLREECADSVSARVRNAVRSAF